MQKRKIILAFSILFSLAFVPLFAQNDDPMTKGSPNQADAFFSQEDFDDALEAYLTLLDKYPDNELYNYRAGVCYLNTNIDKTKAIPYLEVSSHAKKHSPNALYLLARAYQYLPAARRHRRRRDQRPRRQQYAARYFLVRCDGAWNETQCRLGRSHALWVSCRSAVRLHRDNFK